MLLKSSHVEYKIKTRFPLKNVLFFLDHMTIRSKNPLAKTPGTILFYTVTPTKNRFTVVYFVLHQQQPIHTIKTQQQTQIFKHEHILIITNRMDQQQTEREESPCRLCANKNEKVIGIYSEEGIANDLANKMNLYLPIKVSESDELPLQCCWSCASTVLAWHELVVASVEVDRRLRGVPEKSAETEGCFEMAQGPEDDSVG